MFAQCCITANSKANDELILQFQHNPKPHGIGFNEKPTITVHLVTLYKLLCSVDSEKS